MPAPEPRVAPTGPVIVPNSAAWQDIRRARSQTPPITHYVGVMDKQGVNTRITRALRHRPLHRPAGPLPVILATPAPGDGSTWADAGTAAVCGLKLLWKGL